MSEAVDLLALAAPVDLWHLLLLVLLLLLLVLVGVLLLGLFLFFLRGTERVNSRVIMTASRRPRKLSSFATRAPDLLGLGLGGFGLGLVRGIFFI